MRDMFNLINIVIQITFKLYIYVGFLSLSFVSFKWYFGYQWKILMLLLPPKQTPFTVVRLMKPTEVGFISLNTVTIETTAKQTASKLQLDQLYTYTPDVRATRPKMTEDAMFLKHEFNSQPAQSATKMSVHKRMAKRQIHGYTQQHI